MWTRREFAWASGAAAVASLLPPARARGEQGAVGNDSADEVNRCSVMLWPLKGEFAARLQLVAAAGFRNVELVTEFLSWDASEWKAVLARLEALRLRVDAIAPLKLGFADPAGGAAMLRELESVLPALHRLGRPQIILVSGPRPGAAAGSFALGPEGGEADQRQHAVAIETLGKVAAVLQREGLDAVIEPIDRIENPPVYLDSVTEAFALTRAVGSPRVKVLYDFFHEQRTHGNLIEKLEAGIAEVGLVHVAEVPGRHQPGTGEIDYGVIYQALRRVGYQGRVAMEFYPEGDPKSVLRTARLAAEQALAT